ncbi:MAG: transposase [candidate division Zixibacteria bacterium]|nr:transposase [candidate division Zixibacteria bacterium]
MRNSYSKETKAAVIASLLEGQSVSRVARDYNIPSGTVKSWKNRQEHSDNATVSAVATQKKEISDLIIELLETHLRAAIDIACAIDEDYIKKQSASEVAVLLGVINDKAFRMLEALGRAENDDQSTES